MAPIEPVNLGGDARSYIPQLMRAGYSATGALGFLRSMGAGMRTQTFYRAWGEVAADLALRPGVAQLDPSTPISEQQLATWRAGRSGTFGYQVNIALRDRPTGVVGIKTHYVFSADNISPQDAIDQAIADYQSVQTAGGPSGVLVSAYFVQGYQMLGRSGL